MANIARLLRNYGIRAARAISFAHDLYMDGKSERTIRIYKRLVVISTNFLEKHDVTKQDEKVIKKFRAHIQKMTKHLKDIEDCEKKYYEHMEKAEVLAKHWGVGEIKKARQEDDSYKAYT